MSTKVKIFIADGMSKDALEMFEASDQFDVTFQKETTIDELKAALVANEVVAIRSASKIKKDLIQYAKESSSKLKLIIRLGAGVDNIDVTFAKECGIDVMNTASANALSAAEHTIALMFAVARNVPQAYASLKHDEWRRAELVGFELTGKTLGVVGCGQIGRIVIQKALALGMKVCGFDPFMKDLKAYKGLEDVTIYESLDDLLRLSDLVTLHMPKGPQTARMINAEKISKMKTGSVLVNVARGGLEDVPAVLEALNNGRLRAYAVDVFEQEPPTFPSKLISHPKVICTPHLGASTVEAQDRVGMVAYHQIAAYFSDGSRVGVL